MKDLKEITKQYSAVFVGPVRNCAPFLDDVLNNIERIGSLFKSYTCVFVESEILVSPDLFSSTMCKR